MMMIDDSYLDMITDCQIRLSIKTDLVELTLKIDQFVRGLGIWKFNNQLLSDEEFIRGMK